MEGTPSQLGLIGLLCHGWVQLSGHGLIRGSPIIFSLAGGPLPFDEGADRSAGLWSPLFALLS